MAQDKPQPVMPELNTTKAPAFKDGKKVGPADADVQIRPAGAESTADDKDDWDEVDEAVDESFPASDPPAY